MSYGHTNPLTKEKIAERIGQLDAVAGVLVAQLCHDTADMLRAMLPSYGDEFAFTSMCSDPRFVTTDCFVVEVHQPRDKLAAFQDLMDALRAFADFMVAVERGEIHMPFSGRVETDDAWLLFSRMIQGGSIQVPLSAFPLVKSDGFI